MLTLSLFTYSQGKNHPYFVDCLLATGNKWETTISGNYLAKKLTKQKLKARLKEVMIKL
jgi:hypothetical protein